MWRSRRSGHEISRRQSRRAPHGRDARGLSGRDQQSQGENLPSDDIPEESVCGASGASKSADGSGSAGSESDTAGNAGPSFKRFDRISDASRTRSGPAAKPLYAAVFGVPVRDDVDADGMPSECRHDQQISFEISRAIAAPGADRTRDAFSTGQRGDGVSDASAHISADSSRARALRRVRARVDDDSSRMPEERRDAEQASGNPRRIVLRRRGGATDSRSFGHPPVARVQVRRAAPCAIDPDRREALVNGMKALSLANSESLSGLEFRGTSWMGLCSENERPM